MSRKFCTTIESNSPKTFFTIVLYTNMAAVTSRENRESILFHASGFLIGILTFSFFSRKDNFTFKCHRSNGTAGANVQDIYAVSKIRPMKGRDHSQFTLEKYFEWMKKLHNPISCRDFHKER